MAILSYVKILVPTLLIVSFAGTAAVFKLQKENAEAELALAEANLTQLQLALRAQTAALEESQDNVLRTQELYLALQQSNQSLETQVDNYLSIFARHDLTTLAQAKPGLIETRINNATKEVFDNINTVTASN